MSFPNIVNCIICEDIRQEKGGLLTLTGYYGITPYTSILVKEFPARFNRLSFLFTATPGKSVSKVSIAIIEKNKATLIKTAPVDFEIVEGFGGPNQFIFSFNTPFFNSPGHYLIQLLVDDKNAFESSFEIRHGPPAAFLR